MPSTLDPGDRKILLIAGTILLALVVATAAFAPAANDNEGQGVPSTYSTANNGAQAAYLLLSQLGYSSTRWEKSPTELPSRPEGDILILAEGGKYIAIPRSISAQGIDLEEFTSHFMKVERAADMVHRRKRQKSPPKSMQIEATASSQN